MKQALLVTLVVLAAACGSKSKGTDGPPEGDGVPDGALQPGQWDTLDKETRAKWMGKVVKPHMAELFQTHDAAAFSELDCETCHGVESVASGSFEMPSAELPALSADMIAKPADDMKAITEFMMTKVRPSMASFLGRPEWSPQQPDGFGCFGCHPQAE